jgi:hypothetical protein
VSDDSVFITRGGEEQIYCFEVTPVFPSGKGAALGSEGGKVIGGELIFYAAEKKVERLE